MAEYEYSELNFTDRAWDRLYETVDDSYFLDQDSELIYSTLEKRLTMVNFGEYLKRYIYIKAEIETPFGEVPLQEYQQIIKISFEENHTPPSFEKTTARLNALAKNWLTQQSVKRRAVFLLGFGLSMSAEDVEMFLKKALREQGINAKDPFEVLCWYCYRNRLGYVKFNRLWERFNSMPVGGLAADLEPGDYTIGARNAMLALGDEAALMAQLAKLKADDSASSFSRTIRRHFDALFDEARDLVAQAYNRDEDERNQIEVSEYVDKIAANSRLSDAERFARIRQKRRERRTFTREDISEADLEHVISSAIPTDRHGNLTPAKASRLNAQFDGKRFSRQHICDVRAGRAEATRFDLITLIFFIFSQKLDAYPNPKKRYSAFIEYANRILEACWMERLYAANPYECFLLMCILSTDPLGTYADVWELSYNDEKE